MKFLQSLFPFLVVSLLASCTPKEKFYGEWVMTNGDWPPLQLKISEDSVSITELPFVNFYSEKLQIEGGKIKLLNAEFRIHLVNDSLLKLNNLQFIRTGSLYYDGFNINNQLSISYTDLRDIDDKITSKKLSSARIYYGKRLDSNEYSLQLDEYLVNSSADLRWFLLNARPLHSPPLQIDLIADKNSKMNEINWIFKEHRATNVLRLNLINRHEFSIENDTLLQSKMFGVPLRLSYIKEEMLLEKDSTFYSET